MALAERLHRPDLQAHALAWLARCEQAKGNLDEAVSNDRRVLTLAPGVVTATHMLGPLTLYLAGRSAEALVLAADGADAARSSRDTTLIMYSLSHFGLNLTGTGRYAEASAIFQEARVFGRKYGAHSMLARVTSMAAGLHLNVFDYEAAEALRAETVELAGSAASPHRSSARTSMPCWHWLAATTRGLPNNSSSRQWPVPRPLADGINGCGRCD